MTNQQYIKLAKAIEALTAYVNGIDKLSAVKRGARGGLSKLGLSDNEVKTILDSLSVKYYPMVDLGDVLVKLFKHVEGSETNV